MGNAICYVRVMSTCALCRPVTRSWKCIFRPRKRHLLVYFCPRMFYFLDFPFFFSISPRVIVWTFPCRRRIDSSLLLIYFCRSRSFVCRRPDRAILSAAIGEFPISGHHWRLYLSEPTNQSVHWLMRLKISSRLMPSGFERTLHISNRVRFMLGERYFV